MLICVEIQFKGPSQEIGTLLSNMIRNVKLKLEMKAERERDEREG